MVLFVHEACPLCVSCRMLCISVSCTCDTALIFRFPIQHVVTMFWHCNPTTNMHYLYGKRCTEVDNMAYGITGGLASIFIVAISCFGIFACVNLLH